MSAAGPQPVPPPADVAALDLPLARLHQALADPARAASLPYVGAALNAEMAAAAWEPLHYLLSVLLGWDLPGRGLAWWYAAGKPVDEPALRLVRDGWDSHQALDWYAASAYTPGRAFASELALQPAELARSSLCADEAWWRQFQRRGRALRHDPFYGSTGNPLRLGRSAGFGLARVQPDHLQLFADTRQRQATLVVNGFGSWRRDLKRAEKHLPPLTDGAWQLEIFDRRVGYLGLFRRSRDSGSWHLGSAALHQAGRSAPADPGY